MKHVKYFVFTTLLSIPTLSYAENIYCKVVGVTDGDTIKCLTEDKEQLKIKLYQIDAPEKKQAFGNKSKQALSDLIFNETVLVVTYGQDKYRRILGTIFSLHSMDCSGGGGDDAPCATSVDYKDINLEMIDKGMAWYYPFAKKNEQYKQAEEQARKNKVGLWADKKPVAPWEFRKNKNN